MPFIHDDWMLLTPQARTLYHEYAKDQPIVDYHCHLPPAEVAGDKRWKTITEIWLGGDHYKWRQMRSNGVDERLCTGESTDWEKFQAFAGTMPYLLGNPMFHWCQLELARYFDVDDVLGPDNAREVYEACNAVLAKPETSARGLMATSNVRLVCTTDDPTDSLEHHIAVRDDAGFDIQMLPTWRPDKGMAVTNVQAFNAWVDKLAEVADMTIGTFDQYLSALRKRHAFFHSVGCRLSDHGVCYAPDAEFTRRDVEVIFSQLRAGKRVSDEQSEQFQAAMLYEFGLMDHEAGWTQQLHVGAMRNNNTRLFEKLGPDTGFDSIGDYPQAAGISRLLDRLDREGKLAKTILYNLNPVDNHVMATMLGNFQDGSAPGKIQWGSGWWFLDQKPGMEAQMTTLAQLGLLRRFVGMLTDSRSFLSYTRHEYFRRVLCNLLGQQMADGLFPDDPTWVGAMVREICYENAATYFGFDLPAKA